MALVDNFDSYSNGSLNGQGSWSGSTGPQVQGTVVQAGSKAILVNGNFNPGVKKSFTAAATGSQVFYMREDSTSSKGFAFHIYGDSGATLLCQFVFVDGNITLYTNGTSATLVTGFTINTWYKGEIEWDGPGDLLRARVNDGAWSSWYATPAFTNADTIELSSYGGFTANGYYDSLSAAAASGPANLKTYNTNVKANIKSINTNLLANIKSLDTNV